MLITDVSPGISSKTLDPRLIDKVCNLIFSRRVMLPGTYGLCFKSEKIVFWNQEQYEQIPKFHFNRFKPNMGIRCLYESLYFLLQVLALYLFIS